MDRWRLSGCLAAAALFACAWWGGEVDRRRVSLPRALASPERHRGAVIDVFREGRVAEVAGGRVVVHERTYGPDARAELRGLAEPVEVGTPISLRGRFVPPDVLEVLQARVHRTRFVKVWVSLPVLAWIAWLVLTRTRLTRAGVEER